MSDLLPRVRERDDLLGSFATVLASVVRPDLTLLAIPIAFVLALSAARVTVVSTHVGLATASLVGLAAILDAVAVNPPTESG